jgi:hypothetical protein
MFAVDLHYGGLLRPEAEDSAPFTSVLFRMPRSSNCDFYRATMSGVSEQNVWFL